MFGQREMTARPQTIQIYLPLGDPAGIRVASLTTRTVQMFEVPRLLLKDFLLMSESSRVAVYYLFGPISEETPPCYIGQSGSAGERLKQHAKDSGKDFWTTAVVGVSLTNEWTSTHVALLEWLSIDAAALNPRYKLLNGNSATRPYTPAPLEADCSEFFETLAVLLSTLGQPLLEPTGGPQPVANGNGVGATEELFFRERGCDSRGLQTAEGLLVRAGSTGRYELLNSATPALKGQRTALAQEGVVSLADKRLTFIKDYLFPSPSAAGSFIVGGSQNGRTGWRNSEGKNLHQIEADALDAVVTEPEA